MQTLSTEVIRNLAYTISNASAPALKKVKAYTKCSLTDVLTSVVGTAPTSSLLLAEKLLIASLAAPRPSLVRQAGACLSVCFQLAAPLVLIKIAINDSDSNSKVVVLGGGAVVVRLGVVIVAGAGVEVGAGVGVGVG